ncbi:MAG: CHAT domain-containing protein, partial [Cyclobacteriaceae bacterium]|nr:CHAT domain-containing protein [Cyclobacteriaceae bacterium]
DIFNSRLIFKKDSISHEDGELRAYELYDMDLSNLQMVVLSACETGIGKQYEGEGIFSIARGFAYAGCPSIVMSLWKVNDKTTADLIDFFYTNLKDKMPKDEALRVAKLTYIENSDDINAHPSNWAAFITLGNNQAVMIPKAPFQWYYIFIITGFIALLLFLLYRKSKVNIV